MSGEHTPGPWLAVDGNVSGRAVIAPEQPKVRRNVAMCGGPNRDGNSALIASAPDLLCALRDLRAAFMSHTQWNGKPLMEIDAADAAIAKAEGRS